MKTLIIVIHPNINNSLINKRWIDELNKYPEKFHVHELHLAYPDETIDILAEQKLIEQYDKIVFQFPFYWFNSPPLFKKWLDEVLIYGWAYGSESGYKLNNKKIALAISVGIEEKEYSETGKWKYSLKELTTPFEVTFNYVKANYRPFFAYYDVESNTSSEWIEKSIKSYLTFLETL